MNRWQSNKAIVLLTVVMLVLTLLSACSSKNNAKNQGAASQSPSPSSSASSSAQSEQSAEPVELDLFIDLSWYPMKAWTGSVAEKITEKTGVKLNVTVAADDNQLPLMIASGDLPDLVFTYSNVSRLSDSNLSYPWNELIEKYAPDFEIDKTRIAIHTMDDGNFYTVRNAFATQQEMAENKYALGNDGNPGIAYREDILQEIGMSSIQTLDDFMKALGLVKEKYPDMVPLIMDKEWIDQYFLQQFGVEGLLDGWYERDGKVDHILRQPETLDFFKFMNSLYRNGYILAENFAHANDQIDDEYAVSGKAFAHMHTVSVADADNIKVQNNGDSFTFKMLPSSITDKTISVSSGLGFAGTFITKQNRNPEASIKFIQYLASDEGKKLTMFGIEGEHWTWNDEGYPNLNYDPADSNFVESNGIKWWYLYNDGATEGLLSYVPGAQRTQALIERKEFMVYKPELGLIQVQPDSEERTIKTKIDEMVKTEKVKIYLAKSEAEAVAHYENMVKNAENMGLQTLVDWANEIYQKKKGLFE